LIILYPSSASVLNISGWFSNLSNMLAQLSCEGWNS